MHIATNAKKAAAANASAPYTFMALLEATHPDTNQKNVHRVVYTSSSFSQGMIARKETRLITNRKSNKPEAQNPPMATKLSQFAGSLRGLFDSIVHMKTMMHITR